MKQTKGLKVEQVKTGQLNLHPHNARQGDVGAICQSLEAHGQYRPLVVQRSSGNVLAGNHTLQAMQALGWTEADVTYIDVDDDQALRILLVDNRSNDLATYDNSVLTDLLEALVRSDFGLEGTGFDGSDLDDLLAEFQDDTEAEVKDDTKIPTIPENPVTKPGDVWLLGPHRLICGDSTNPTTYATLLRDDRADCIWTDPPYGVEYVGKTKDALTIKNDGEQGLAALLRNAFACWNNAGIEGAAVYIAHPAGALSLTFLQAFMDAGWRLHQTLCWNKGTIVLGHSDYHYSHEPILFGYLPGGGAEAEEEQDGTATTRSAAFLTLQSPTPTRSIRP